MTSDADTAPSTTGDGAPGAGTAKATSDHSPPKLALSPRILELFGEAVRRRGLVREQRAAKLVYLGVTSRFLESPISMVVKGQSSTGKSRTVDTVLEFFPASAVYKLTGMSRLSLAYGKEPLKHRIIYLREAQGLRDPFAAYLMRTFLSEGGIDYDSVESTKDGLKPVKIKREGPVGLLATTTSQKLERELETRFSSIPTDDSAAQTRAVIAALAEQFSGATRGRPVDLSEWHALQGWLEKHGERRVVIPFAPELIPAGDHLPPRLRRDFKAVLGLVVAHAFLHQATRQRDTKGRIVATLDDYAAVYELVHDLIAEGVQAAVRKEVRQTVEAVAALQEEHEEGVSLTALMARLGEKHKSTVSRRVDVAVENGWLRNLEDRKGRPALLVPGDPMPQEGVEVMVPPGAVREALAA